VGFCSHFFKFEIKLDVYRLLHNRKTQEESIRKWQHQWEETTKEAITKEFFSKCRKKTGREFTLKPKRNNNYDWKRKYSFLLTPIKNHRQSGVSMQTKHTNNSPFDISVRKVKVRKRSAEEQCT
jgi:hypothetical protein